MKTRIPYYVSGETVHLREKVVHKFGVDFLIKNGQVFLFRKYGPIEYYVLIENDPEFLFELLKVCQETRYLSREWLFIPTKGDWRRVRNNTSKIILNFTTKCNSECNICFVKEGPYDEMSLQDIKEILSKIGKRKTMVLFGGEPTVRKDIFKIIKLIKKSGNDSQLYTNGLKLADQDFVKKLKESGVKSVIISFDGFREDIYERMRGNGEHLYLKLKALKNLEKFNIDTHLSITLASGINDDELPKLLRFAIDNNHFIKGLNVYGATAGYGKFDIDMKKCLTPSDIGKILEDISSGVITNDYFVEFKKFRMNIVNILKKLGLFFPKVYYISPVPFIVEDHQLKELIPLKELKKINDCIRNRKISHLIRYLVKNGKHCLSFLKFLLRNFDRGVLRNNVLTIYFGNIITPLNYIPIDGCKIGISKIKNNKTKEDAELKDGTSYGIGPMQ